MSTVSSQSPDPDPAPGTGTSLLRALVLCDLVDSTALMERLGDRRGVELIRKHDRLARALAHQHNGQEIDKTDGFLLMFVRPVQAVAFAVDYQRGLDRLSAAEGMALASRVGIHVGDVVVWQNTAEDIANGAKPIEVEGLAKPITSRLTNLALPNQILLSGIAYALSQRADSEFPEVLKKARWRSHGRYSFKGIPEPIPVFEVGDDDLAPLKAPPWSGKAHREIPFWRRPTIVAAQALALSMLVAVPIWFTTRSPPAIAFANRDWVVVGDMNNLTGESVFDDTLQTAFRVSLQQSRHVNLLSDLKARNTVKLMQLDPAATRIDRAVGSEIAIRDGARALILPSIAEIGGRVRITAEVIDPKTRTTVYAESAEGAGADSVLASLDTVNQKLRVRLGEALATVSDESLPLENVATSNLEALRAYSLGERARSVGQLREAAAYLRQAVKIDSGFALGHLALAQVLVETGQFDLAAKEVDLAIASRPRLSERDALYLDAYQATFGSPAGAIEKWKILTTLYPDFLAAQGRYAFYAWHLANRYEEAIEAARRAASKQNPQRASANYLLATLLLGSERYEDAIQNFMEAETEGAKFQNEYYASAYAAQRKFKKAYAALAAGSPSGVPGNDLNTNIVRVAFAIDQGKWGDAWKTLEQTKKESLSIGLRHTRQFEAVEFSLRTITGSNGPQVSALRKYIKDEKSLLVNSAADRTETQFHTMLTAYLAAREGDTKLAESALASVGPEPRDSAYPLLNNMYLVARAEIARASGHPADAIILLKPLIDGSELYITHVALKDAYATSRDHAAALDKAGWLANHRGRAYAEPGVQEILTAFNVAESNLALLHIAELSLALGEAEAADQALRRFQEIWPDVSQQPLISARLKMVRDRKI